MKKLIRVMLVLCLALTVLVGCGDSGSNEKKDEKVIKVGLVRCV